MKVRANQHYIYFPNILDRLDPQTKLRPGDLVRVMNIPGLPEANTMDHAHVTVKGQLVGMVHTSSLYVLSDRDKINDLIRSTI